MRNAVLGFGITCMLSLLAPAAIAEDQLEADFDYDAAIEDIPIEFGGLWARPDLHR